MLFGVVVITSIAALRLVGRPEIGTVAYFLVLLSLIISDALVWLTGVTARARGRILVVMSAAAVRLVSASTAAHLTMLVSTDAMTDAHRLRILLPLIFTILTAYVLATTLDGNRLEPHASLRKLRADLVHGRIVPREVAERYQAIHEEYLAVTSSGALDG